MPTRTLKSLSLCLLGVITAAASAQAAPQILGLVATAEPLPMTCTDTTCTVEVSGVCLQEHRPAPTSGTAYRAAKGARLTLSVHLPDGRTRSSDIAGAVRITSLRTFSSVAVEIPADLVTDLAGSADFAAALTVGPLVSAIPIAEPNDANPITEAEIREMTGPGREIAESAILRDEDNLTATRLLNQMVNRLPADSSLGRGHIPMLRGDVVPRDLASARPGAARFIDRALKTCNEKLRIERTPHLRHCLANQHDIVNSETTQAVWRALKPGS